MVSGIRLICFMRTAPPTPLLIVFIVVMLLRVWRIYGFRHWVDLFCVRMAHPTVADCQLLVVCSCVGCAVRTKNAIILCLEPVSGILPVFGQEVVLPPGCRGGRGFREFPIPAWSFPASLVKDRSRVLLLRLFLSIT